MFHSRHVLFCVITLYIFYCFATEVQIHEKAIERSQTQICRPWRSVTQGQTLSLRPRLSGALSPHFHL
uniref:Secreted protein n=1 Tax=Panagrellus redivivus TaxID=6233 RepID=A0A7E4VVS4_PANRE